MSKRQKIILAFNLLFLVLAVYPLIDRLIRAGTISFSNGPQEDEDLEPFYAPFLLAHAFLSASSALFISGKGPAWLRSCESPLCTFYAVFTLFTGAVILLLVLGSFGSELLDINPTRIPGWKDIAGMILAVGLVAGYGTQGVLTMIEKYR